MVHCLGRCVHKARLGHGTLLGKMCTQGAASAWYIVRGRYVHKARLGHGTLLMEDVYTSRDCMVHCLGRYVHKARLWGWYLA